jgi:hypothetical protein
LTAGLVASPPSSAAKKVAATLDDDLILLHYESPDGYHQGLAIRFTGADGTQQEVRVTPPRSLRREIPLLVSFKDAPAGTQYYSCTRLQSFGVTVPKAATAIPHHSCMLGTRDRMLPMLVQTVAKRVPDFGGAVASAIKDVYVSVLPDSPADDFRVCPNPTQSQCVDSAIDAAILQAHPRWSKFYSGTRARSANKHFPVLFGSLTFGGVGVYGPGNRLGSPTNEYGRNVYIDTLDSDYGPGWRRVMGVLTQPTNGTFCYEFSKKGGSSGKTGVSKTNTYRLTAIGPGLTPVVRINFQGPTFPYGNASYNPLTDKWGTNFSPEQTAALIQQTATMGPNWRRPVKGTDCAYTLRQLPDGFIPPAYTVAP